MCVLMSVNVIFLGKINGIYFAKRSDNADFGNKINKFKVLWIIQTSICNYHEFPLERAMMVNFEQLFHSIW